MLPALALAALLSAGPGHQVEALRHELDGVAARIAELKARAMEGEDVGSALEPLLVRAQELAEALERSAPGLAAPRAVPTSVEELRARADALYDEAEALAGALVELDGRIGAALEAGARSARPRPGRPGPILASAVEGKAPACPSAAPPRTVPSLAPLLEQRARLKARVRHLLAEAAALDDAADRLQP